MIKLSVSRRNITDSILVLLLLFISGNFLAKECTEYIYILIVILLSTIYQIKFLSLLKNKKFVILLISLIIIFLFQKICLGFVSIPACVNYIFKLISGCLIVIILGDRFSFTYFKVMYFLAIVSLILYSLILVTNFVPNIFIFDRYYSVILYNHIVSDVNGISSRNSGMFWEPGAFQGYINLVPLLFLKKLPELWKQYTKECIVLLIALITTQSTTGLIILFLIVFYHYSIKNNNRFKSAFVTVLLIGIFLIAFLNIDFLGEKIKLQYIEAIELDVNRGEISWNRIGAALTDWHYIKKSPLIGNGFHYSTRWIDHDFLDYEMLGGFGNGFTGIIHSLGIIFILIYFILLSKKLAFNTYDKAFFLFAIFILLQGEDYLIYPLFLSLPFVNYKNATIEYKKAEKV